MKTRKKRITHQIKLPRTREPYEREEEFYHSLNPAGEVTTGTIIMPWTCLSFCLCRIVEPQVPDTMFVVKLRAHRGLFSSSSAKAIAWIYSP